MQHSENLSQAAASAAANGNGLEYSSVPSARVRLRAHQNRSGTTVHGGASIGFGLIFAGIGVFIGLVAGGVIDAKDRAPSGVIGACALVFFLPGLSLITHGIRGLRRRARLSARAAQCSGQPWLADHDWDPAGETERHGSTVSSRAFGFVVVALLSVPFNALAFAGGAYKSGWLYGLACVNFIPMIYAVATVHAILRWRRFGAGRLNFRQFPYVLGRRMEADFLPGRMLAGITSVECTLRCVQEAYETRQVNGKTRTEIVSYELHRQTCTLDATALSQPGRVGLLIAFDLPADAVLATCLAEAPPRYWELELCAKVPGVNFRAIFLLPVYAALKAPGPMTSPARTSARPLAETFADSIR